MGVYLFLGGFLGGFSLRRGVYRMGGVNKWGVTTHLLLGVVI